MSNELMRSDNLSVTLREIYANNSIFDICSNFCCRCPVAKNAITSFSIIVAQVFFILLISSTADAGVSLPGAILTSGNVLESKHELLSPNGKFFLTTQTDGNLCVYHESDNAYVWCSRDSSAGEGQYFTAMQSDGNLCTYRQGTVGAIWCSGMYRLFSMSWDEGTYFLAIQDDANVCVYPGSPGHGSQAIWCSDKTAYPDSATRLVYGRTYHVQNGYAQYPAGGFLDVRGAGCNGNFLCVSTSESKERDRRSGTWMIVSAEGKSTGDPVIKGDIIYLKNLWGSNSFGGYLSVEGNNCEDNVLCVSTSADLRGDESKWTVEGGRYFVHEGDSIHLRSASVGKTYLDVRGAACNHNLLCVSASESSNRHNKSGTWRLFWSEKDDYAKRFAPRLRLENNVKGLPMSAQVYYNHVLIQGNDGLENKDINTMSSGAIPTYYQLIRVGKQLRIKYWWFYGYQQTCDTISGSHNGDWEDVTVTLAEDGNSIAAVTFTMHGHPYTRLAKWNGFGIEADTHPVVHVAKTSHASHFASGGTSNTCLPWEEFHHTNAGYHMDSWMKVVDLDKEEEPWMVRDKTRNFYWGNDATAVGTHPTTQGPTAFMKSTDNDFLIHPWRHSQCLDRNATGCEYFIPSTDSGFFP